MQGFQKIQLFQRLGLVGVSLVISLYNVPGQGPMVFGVSDSSLFVVSQVGVFLADGRGAADGGGLVSNLISESHYVHLFYILVYL